MDNRELNKALRDRARDLGLCDKWYDEWDKDCTRQELIEKYLKGIDFCIKHDYPKLYFIKTFFPNEQLAMNGIFVDENIDALNVNTAVALGKSTGTIRYEGQHAGTIYTRHESSIEVTAMEGARVFVEVWDDSKVKVITDEESKAFVYWHGGEIVRSGNVTVRNRR